MLSAFGWLLGFAVFGEAASRGLHLPLPGSVVGMLALAAWLLLRTWRGRRAARGDAGGPTPHLQSLSAALIRAMGVMFVPAGVGLVTELGRLRREALPIGVALVGSTLFSIWVTGAVMNLALRAAARRSMSAS